MGAYNILHVTDFHIFDPQSGLEHLSQGYYKEYLDSLSRELRQTEFGAVDAIVATGDFVDSGEVQNFDHAANVLVHLATILEVPSARIVVCIGNHDVVRALDASGSEDGARVAYNEFAAKLSNGASTHSSARGCFGRVMDGLWFLVLDS